MNLIIAFAIALKHKLRFEPLVCYEDLTGLIGYLDTFLKEGNALGSSQHRAEDPRKVTAARTGLPFPAFGPQKLVRDSEKPLEELPLEILNHIAAYIDHTIRNNTMVSGHQGDACKSH
jgi:hypothetical protein